MFLAQIHGHGLDVEQDFKKAYEWDENDLVIWNNGQSMHRGLYYDDQTEIRDVRRTTISGSEMLIPQ